jgi:hypothetical protein
MKTKNMIWMVVFFILLVAVLVTANFNAPVAAAQTSAAGSPALQSTPTLLSESLSEVGSTDGIMIMGVVIVLIVVVPLILRKK